MNYRPSIYWITVVFISVFGTVVTDNLTDSMGVALELSTEVFSVLLGLTFLFWYIIERTLSIHSIFTIKREVFYWLTILLGASLGDYLSQPKVNGGLGLGTTITSIIFLIAILVRLTLF